MHKRRGLLLLAVLSIVLGLPVLKVGFVADDYPQLLTIQGLITGGATPFDLYRFTAIDGATTQEVMARGPWPWWTHPDLLMAFWRPLPSALVNLDHWLFGLSPLGYAVHSLLYNALLVVVAALFFRRVLPPSPAFLAALLFAIDDAHLQGASWVASRYTVIAPLFGLLAILCHLKWREDRSRLHLAAALLCFVVSLSCGEIALSALAYFVLYEAVVRDDAPKKRVFALLPVAVLTGIYLIVHHLLGYGVANSGLYYHPLSDPLNFFRQAPTRMGMLFGDLFGGLPSDFAMGMLDHHFAWAMFGLITAVLFILVVRLAYRDWDPIVRRRARWLLGASVLALLPTLGAPPGGRLLVLPSVGVLAVTALCLSELWQRLRGRELASDGKQASPSRSVVSGVGLRLGLGWVVAVHLLGAPLAGLARVGGFIAMGKEAQTILEEARPLYRSAHDVLVVQCTNHFVGLYGAGEVAARDPSVKIDSWHILSSVDGPHRIRRVTEQGFELEFLEGGLLDNPLAKVFRDTDYKFVVGDVHQTASFSLTVLEEHQGQVKRIGLELKRKPSDPKLAIVRCDESGLVSFQLPAVGEATVIPAGPRPLKM